MVPALPYLEDSYGYGTLTLQMNKTPSQLASPLLDSYQGTECLKLANRLLHSQHMLRDDCAVGFLLAQLQLPISSSVLTVGAAPHLAVEEACRWGMSSSLIGSTVVADTLSDCFMV